MSLFENNPRFCIRQWLPPVLAFSMVLGLAAVASSQCDPSAQPGSAAVAIPIPNTGLVSFRFFESGVGAVPYEERVYANRFQSDTARFINWELRLAHKQPGVRLAFTIESIWYGPDGTEMGKQEIDSKVTSSWPSSWHSNGWGWLAPGHWKPGKYCVTLSVAGKEIAQGGFEVVATPDSLKGKQEEVAGFPIPNSRVRQFRFFESGPEAGALGARSYTDRFNVASTRFIHWELHLDHPRQPGIPSQFQILAVWYDFTGNAMTRQTVDTRVDATWPTSYHNGGIGWSEAGKWPPGKYRVALFIEGQTVAAGLFEITP